MEQPVFVYGTLKPGGKLYRHVADVVGDVKTARVQGRLYETPFGYPLLVPSGEEGVWVQGFLLQPKKGAQEELQEIIDCIEL
ncbi:MAG: gamma-glutamylcyclotransferase, partial [Candidatus Geothermincolia bacterium]